MANHINKTFNGLKMPVGNDVSLSVFPDYSVTVGKLHLSLGPSYTYMLNALSDGQRLESHQPTAQASLGYRLNDRVRFNARLSMGLSYRTLGTMYGGNKYYDSENYYQEGNFRVKACRQYNASVGIAYYSPDGNLSLGADGFFQYKTNPFYQYVVRNGDDYVQTTLNAKRGFQASGSIYGSYKPQKWLEAYVYVSLLHYDNPTMPIYGSAYKRYNNFSATMQLTARHRQFWATASYRNGTKMHEGDILCSNPFTFEVQMGWGYRDFYIAGVWSYNKNRYTETMSSDGFVWRQFSPQYSRHIFAFRVSYFFTHGVYKYRKEAKSVSVGGDAGTLR